MMRGKLKGRHLFKFIQIQMIADTKTMPRRSGSFAADTDRIRVRLVNR